MVYEVGFKNTDKVILLPADISENTQGAMGLLRQKTANGNMYIINWSEVLYVIPVDENKINGINPQLKDLLEKQIM